MGMTSIQRKGREIVIEFAREPGLGIMTPFAVGYSVDGEPFTMNILMTLRTRGALVLE